MAAVSGRDAGASSGWSPWKIQILLVLSVSSGGLGEADPPVHDLQQRQLRIGALAQERVGIPGRRVREEDVEAERRGRQRERQREQDDQQQPVADVPEALHSSA